MVRRIVSSRQRFKTYLDRLRRRRAGDSSPPDSSKVDLPAADSQQADSLPQGPAAKSHRRARSSLTLIRRFFALLGRQRLAVAFALCTLTISTTLGLIPPAATKVVVDYVLAGQPLPAEIPDWLHVPTDRWQQLLWITVALAAISFVRISIHLWGRWHATRATKRLQMDVRKRAFEHAMRLPLNRVQDLKSGGVASLLREDAGSVAELVFGMLYNPWQAVIQLAGSLCVLAWVDWKLLAGALILIPLVFATHRTWISRIRPQHREIRARRQAVDALATETFGGMRVVRGFSRQRTEGLRFMRGNHLMARQELHVWWWSRTIEIVWEALIPLASAGLLLYGGTQVLNGSLTLGDLMMFIVYLLMLLEPLAVLAQSAAQFQNSLSALDRILDLLEERREMIPSADSVRLRKQDVAGALAFENVTFQYPGTDRPALRDISLGVEPGQTIGLVGPSGSGKTTLCNLVARFYDPSEGRILLDGRDLKEIEVENYRSLLGVVEQDVFLFDGTIFENIGYAVRDTTLDEVRQAAEIANAARFISELPNGYETLIGERGVKLSGGERQRIAIARAVLADPRILILDEATSNLDTESERLIQFSLATLMRDRTSFVIAHRLSTIAHADCIVVLEDGQIREVGTHEQLMEIDSKYRDMVLMQTGMQADLTP